MSGEIVTYTGRIINPLEPDPSLIDIDDIGHALSNLCRFTGHVRHFYSVAQHSVLASRLVSKENELWGLLHDASEAYLSDLARPVKYALGLGDVYREAEERLTAAIAERFSLGWPIPEEVHHVDKTLLRSEQRDLMPALLRYEGADYVDFTIEGWLPGVARDMFLARYRLLTGDYTSYEDGTWSWAV